MVSKEEITELKHKEELLKKAAEILRVNDADLPRVIDRFLKEVEEMNSHKKSIR